MKASATSKKQLRLARYQRSLPQKVKFSNNLKKQKDKISKLHSTIANIRKDTLHKTTTTLSLNHTMIVIEDLQVSNMSKSVKCTVENKGWNIKAKSGLNLSIIDQGWFEFRRQLEYKLVWAVGKVLAVNPHNTSRTCPCCKRVAKENRLTQAKFECVECGYSNNSDLVGGINILAAGHAVFTCLTDVGDSSAYISNDAHYGDGVTVQQDRTVKHEPAEGIGKSSREPLGIHAL